MRIYLVLDLDLAFEYVQLLVVLLPFLTLDLLLSIMTYSVKAIHAILANGFISRVFSVGIINHLELVNGWLHASFGRNLPVTDSDLVVARIVFEAPDVMTRNDVSSQRTYSVKQSSPFLIDGHSVALEVALANFNASFRRTEFDGPDPTIKGFEVIFWQPTVTLREKTAEVA